MKRSELRADPDKVREFQQRARSNSTRKRRAVSPASPAQREAVKGERCIVCLGEPVDPAHIIDRSLCPEGADDPRAVAPLCRFHHDLYDRHELSLLEHLEPRYREEIAFAVLRFGLVSTYKRLTGDFGMNRMDAA